MRIGLPVSIALHAVLLVLLLVDLPWFRRTPEAMVIAPSFGVVSGTELDAILADSASRDPDLPFSIATADVEPPPLPPVEPPPTAAPDAPPAPEAPDVAVPEPADSAPPIEAVGVPLPPGPAEAPPLDAPTPTPAPAPSPADTAAPPEPATAEPPPVAAAPPEPAPEAPAEPAAEPTAPLTPDTLADPLPETAPEAPPETATEPEPDAPTEAPVEVAEAPPPDAAQEPPPDTVPVSDLPPPEDDTQVAVVSPPAPPDAPLPDRRPTPPPQPVRAQPPPDPEPPAPADPLDALVSQVAGGEPQQAATPNTPPPAGVAGAVRLSRSDEDRVRAAIERCYNIDPAAPSVGAILVRVVMNRDGSVASAELAGGNADTSQRYRAAAERALRAARNQDCQPWPLPAADWPNWQHLELNFDPQSFF